MNIFHVITKDLSLDRASGDLESFSTISTQSMATGSRLLSIIFLGVYLEKWAPCDLGGQIVWCSSSFSVSVIVADNQQIFYAKITFLGSVNLRWTCDTNLLNQNKGVNK